MGLMDKAKQAVKGRSAQIERGVDKAAQMVDKRTGGKYQDKVAKGADQIKSRARTLDDDRRGPTPGTTPTTGLNDQTSGATTPPAGTQDGTLTNGHGDSSAPRPTAPSDPTSGTAHLGDRDQSGERREP